MAFVIVQEKDVQKRALATKAIPLPVKILLTMVFSILPAVLKPPRSKDITSLLIDIRDILNDASLD